MSDPIPQDQFPPWRGRVSPTMSRAALALGLVEEAMGNLDEGNPARARNTLMLARSLLLEATAADAARVALALLTPITDEEVGE